MRKLIVGCGYLGRRVAAQWIAEGHQVSALTRSPANAQSLQSAGIGPVIGDVTDPASLSRLPAADVVVYAVGLDRNSGQSQREVYVTGLRNVLAHLPSSVKRFIYISSTSVYGQTAGEWIDETSPCLPSRENGQVCLEAEQALREHFREQSRSGGFNILRLAGIYGPQRLLSRIETLRSGEPLSGHPEAWLNLIHADDAAAAVLACETHGTASECYLVCDDEPIHRRRYYQLLASLVGAPPPRFQDEAAESDSRQLNKRCSNQRLYSELCMELQFPTIAEGLPHAVGR
jgi:nucleoside-diphosphate-sugar epimerase